MSFHVSHALVDWDSVLAASKDRDAPVEYLARGPVASWYDGVNAYVEVETIIWRLGRELDADEAKTLREQYGFDPDVYYDPAWIFGEQFTSFRSDVKMPEPEEMPESDEFWLSPETAAKRHEKLKDADLDDVRYLIEGRFDEHLDAASFVDIVGQWHDLYRLAAERKCGIRLSVSY